MHLAKIALVIGVAMCVLGVYVFIRTREAPVEHLPPIHDSIKTQSQTPNIQTMDEETLKRAVGAGPQPGTFKGPTEPPPGR